MDDSDDEPATLTVREVARLLGVTQNAVRQRDALRPVIVAVTPNGSLRRRYKASIIEALRRQKALRLAEHALICSGGQ